MTYRVIQCATGTVGKESLRAIAARDDLELVGVRVYSEAKRGLDAGEIAGLDTTGVRATDDFDSILATPADCAIYHALGDTFDTDAAVTEICALLASGKNVVSTSVSPPWCLEEAINQRLRAACEEGDTSYLAVGLNPGYVLDVWPVVLSRVTRRVDRIAVVEIEDMSDYASAQVIGYMGFGQPPDAPIPIIAPTARAEDSALFGHFRPSILMIERALGWSLDEFRVEHDVALADRRIEMAATTVEPGTIAAVRSRLTAGRDGAVMVSFEAVWKASSESPVGWPGAAGKSVWHLHLDGDPSLDTSLQIGTSEAGTRADMVMVAAHAVNAVPTLVAAGPGIRTFLDLPAFGGVGVRLPRAG